MNKARAERLEVSDEEIAEAAIAFVEQDSIRRVARDERNNMIKAELCFNRNENMRSCFQGLELGRLFTQDQFCERCLEVTIKTKELKLLAARRNGKLRRLRNLVQRRRGATS